jgi:hypothetical protein
MTGRRLVPPDNVLATLFWPEKTIAARLLDQALAADPKVGALNLWRAARIRLCDGLDVPAVAERGDAAHQDPADLVRHRRVDDELAVDRMESEHGSGQVQRSSGRPGLGAARGWVRDGDEGPLARVADERLGQAVAELGGGVE